MERDMEIERKFSVGAGRPLPSLPEGLRHGPTQEFSLRATYFDTPDLLLARNRRTLRRRTGGDDAGWHLKLPATAAARTEVRLELAASRSPLVVPTALRDEVAGIVGTAPLIPVAQLRTVRRQTEVLDDGRSVAVVADDTVTAHRLGEAAASAWREVEVELTGGTETVLDSITRSWLQQGVTVSPSVSKLAQALGDAVTRAQSREVTSQTPAAEVALDYLAAQVGMLQARHAGLATDEPDAVHKSRVATRRIRSALASWRSLWDDDRLEPLAAEVKWLGAVLGGPRDAEVLRDTLVDQAGHLNDVPAESVEGLRAALESDHAAAFARLQDAMELARYVAVHERLVDLIAHPPTPAAAPPGPAADVMPRVLDQAGNRVRKHFQSAQKHSGDHRLHELHETRKKAKRARYAAEAAAAALREDASSLATQWESVTEALGQLQDSVVAEEVLQQIEGVDPELVTRLLDHQRHVRETSLTQVDPGLMEPSTGG